VTFHFVVHPLSFELAFVAPNVHTCSVNVIPGEVPDITTTVGPFKSAFSALLALQETTYKYRTVSPFFSALTMLFVSYPAANIFRASY
jgi:hypothetical protein